MLDATFLNFFWRLKNRRFVEAKMHLRERALNALAFQKRTPKKNVGFLTRARLESRNVPSTAAGLRVSPLPCFFSGGAARAVYGG